LRDKIKKINKMIKKIIIKRMSIIFDIKTKWNEMKRDKIEIIPKTNKDRSKEGGTQLKQITNGKTTLDFGWPNADFNEMREKRVRRRKKSYFYQTTMKFTICVAPSVVLSLDVLDNTTIRSFWSLHMSFEGRRQHPLVGECIARANHFFLFYYYFYLLKDWFALNSNRL